MLLVGGPGCGLGESGRAAHVIDSATGRPLTTLCNPTYDENSDYASAGLLAAGRAFIGDPDDDADQVWMFSPCSDGVLSPGEECDDGNRVDGDGCDRNCTVSRCGNGRRSQGERCRDDLFRRVFDTPGLAPPACTAYSSAPGRVWRHFEAAVDLVRTAAAAPDPEDASAALGGASDELGKALRALREGARGQRLRRLRRDCAGAIARMLRSARGRIRRAQRPEAVNESA